MSARSGICKSVVEGLKNSLKGTAPYVTNMYDNIGNKVVHIDNVASYPYISVTPGPEVRDDQPSNITFGTLTVYCRVFVQNMEDSQGELEQIISDIETYLDNNLRIEYTVPTNSGSVSFQTITNNIVSITTDEGLLDPLALGEVVVDIQYEKLRT